MLGLATLVRPSSLLAGPLFAMVEGRPWRRALLGAATVTAVALTVVMPWTLRNCRVMDGCAFVSTNGGWNLAIGAVGDSGRFSTLRGTDGCPIVSGQVQQDRCWAKLGRDTILRDPSRWLALIPRKLGHTFDHESFAVEYLREADPRSWPEDRRAAGRRLLGSFHRMLLVLAALGAVARPMRGGWATREGLVQLGALGVVLGLGAYATLADAHPFFWLALAIPLLALLPGAPEQGRVGRYLIGLLGVTMLTHAVFFGDDRYHLVVTPALCVLGAGALRNGRLGAMLQARALRRSPQPA